MEYMKHNPVAMDVQKTLISEYEKNKASGR